MIPILLLTAALVAPQDSARLTVAAAVDRALASHPAIAAARANVDVASADVRQMRAAWLPSVSLDGAVNKFEKPMIVWPLHGLDLRNPPSFDTELSQASLGASYTLFDFGARGAKVKSAQSSREAADASLGATEQQVIARAVGAYLRVLNQRELLAVESRRIDALIAEAKRARDRYAAGKAPLIDTLRAAAELASAAADRSTTAANATAAEYDLARMIGTSYAAVHDNSLCAINLVSAPLNRPTDATAQVSRELRGNADVLAAERRAAAAAASVGVARAARLPQMQLTSALVDRSNITGKWLTEWQMGVGMSWPLYTGGARTSAINRAEAASRAEQERLRLARMVAEQQADDARALFDASLARVTALQAADAQAIEVARIAALSRDVGGGTQTDYLLAEATALKIRTGMVQSYYAAIAARVELARVLGELNRSWIVTSLESQP